MERRSKSDDLILLLLYHLCYLLAATIDHDKCRAVHLLPVEDRFDPVNRQKLLFPFLHDGSEPPECVEG